ncbi:alpha-N-arabinofuranosidase [Oleiharenicola lentus]|uniref:alpha-N-arabinofuranosidase n=1 Tax=Oleiharenicola lentus TaxID=2508720 RepID=UPI003F666702
MITPTRLLRFGLLALTATCSFVSFSARAAESGANATLTLNANKPGPIINRNIYGHFAEHLGRCIYEGIWVGPDSPIPNTRGLRNDVIAALKNLNIPVLRWPGGCFADEYHWKDGIGPRESRPSVFNSHWGGVVENNHFGTHEFMDLCEILGTEPYIAVNVGSGTVKEMMEWIDYLTSDAQTPMANMRRAHGREKAWKVKYLGIGNESWGCGGNMRPEFYADVYRQFNTFAKNFNPDNRLYRIACGSSGEDLNWTEVMMKNAGKQMNGLSLHWYTLPTGNWKTKGSSTEFEEAAWITTLRRTLRMDYLVAEHGKIMDKYDPEKKVGLIVDEWGTWYDVEPGTNPGFLYQQNTMRDAVVAALNFHVFHKYADRVTMANIAQTINVLQAVILTDKEKMLLTPTYHVFEMFKVHQDATSLAVDLKTPDYAYSSEKIPAVSASASRNAAGKIHLSLVNTNPTSPITVTCTLDGAATKTVTGRILTAPAMNSHNTFAAPEAVKPATFTGATLTGNALTITLPAKSVVVLALE